MEDKIKEAITLLRQNNYIVVKWNEEMEEDSDRCINGEEMLCSDCACHVCTAGCD